MKRLLAIVAIVLLLGFSSVCRADITSNLVAWWKLDETSGTNAADSTGNGHDGTYTNTPTLGVTGAFGTSKAVTFANASSQYVLFDDSSAYPVGNTGLTVSFWINVTSTISSQICVGKWGTAGNREWNVYLDSISRPRFAASSDGTASSAAVWSSGLTLGQWYFVVCRHDPVADTISISVDAATPVITSGFTGGLYDSSSPVGIGYAPASPYLNGTIDDVRIYNRALSAGDVSQLYAYTGAKSSWHYYYRNSNLKPCTRFFLPKPFPHEAPLYAQSP